ncbi:MAG: TauD/TfdA family dioxygenase [Deltaproteobacteria bacterium]|nr:TauD/TfdA family dioxygenase [Deltaproteobacteria bacterium]MBW2362449.1 TauD/TfdA family dioxygenase [Deltaproteobacteria bacterium]
MGAGAMSPTPIEPFGVELQLDTSRPLTDTEASELRRTFTEHGLLVLRDHEVTPEWQAQLMARLGRVEAGADGQPLLLHITNQSTDSSAPQGELTFHFDYAYDPEPIPAISLYGLEVAEAATPTLFANSSQVLSRIPGDLLAQVEGRDAAHFCFPEALDAAGEREAEPDAQHRLGDPSWGSDDWRARHPVIWRNGAGVPTLFLCRLYTQRVLGMPRAESDALLRELYQYVYDAEHIYEHQWRPNDLVIWDNLTLQHARLVPNDKPRVLRRYHLSNTDLTEEYLRVGRANAYL